jgi:hypothetical protein
MINYICQVITGKLVCGRPLKKVHNNDPLTNNYFDLFLCSAGHRVLLLRSSDTESDAKKTEPGRRQP